MVKKRGKGSSAATAAAQWKVGDLVLAKVKGFPAWPAQVSRAEDFGRQRNPAKVFVVFFGTQQIRFCHHSEISAFTLEARAALHARTLSKCVPSDLKKAVNEICAAADKGKASTANEAPEQTSSNADIRNADEESVEQTSLESRRGNGSTASQANKRKRVKIESEEPEVSTKRNQPESSCTNSCSSFPEDLNHSRQGVRLADRVLTNFASLEDLDSFGNDAGCRERKRRQEQTERHVLNFTWSRQCTRTFRKRTLNLAMINICKTQSTKWLHAKSASSESEERNSNNAESFEDFKRADLKAFKKQRVADQKFNEAPDKHLPLLKRASVRIIHEGACDKAQDSSNRRCVGEKLGTETDDMQESETSKKLENRQLPPKAEKYRLRSCLQDEEAALPPCKRRQRVLDAITVRGEDDRNTTSKNLKHGKALRCNRSGDRSEVTRQGSESFRAENAKTRKAAKWHASTDIQSAREEKEKPSNQGECPKKVYTLSLDALPPVHASSKLFCEEVNRVREAYEAAKEKKQKLASKFTSAPSSSMKYLLAVQSKQAYLRRGSDTRDASMSMEAETAQTILERSLDNLSRSKDSIGRVTRQAVDCARLGTSEQVMDLIARRMESEKSFHKRIDLFLAVDSIAQWANNQRGTCAGVYSSLVQNTLPRLLSAAAPPGNFARENRRQCLKVLHQWLERNVLPESVVRHFMREIEFHDADKPAANLGQRPSKTERSLNDPIREMEGMQVDEYGSNAGFPLQGLVLPRLAEEEELSGESSDESPAPAHEPGQKHPHVLEQVDGELEMEDVSPVIHQYERPQLYFQAAPPPLPSSPPPCTPPPPPPQLSSHCYLRFGCAT